MARAAGKKQAPAKVEEDDDDSWDDAVVEADAKDSGGDLRLRDWRDVERFREMKELRSLVDDDYGLEEIFRVPLKPRAEQARAAKLAAAAKAAATPAKPVAKLPAKTAPPKAAAKPAPNGARARSEPKPAAKAKAKAKRK